MKAGSEEGATSTERRKNTLSHTNQVQAWCLLFLMLLVVGFIRVRLLNLPLERDEGEYAYAGQLIMQGVPPYQECYNMKWPGTYLAYAGIMALFGQSAAGIHLGLLVVTLASALLVFQIGRRIGGNGMGVVAGGTQALLAVNPSMFGLAGHATHFVVLPALGGIWILMTVSKKPDLWRYAVAGALFGLASIMKQPGAIFGLFAAIWMAWRGLSEGGQNFRRVTLRLATLAAGGLLPLLAMAGTLVAAGVWRRFWHWTVEYAWAYVGNVSFSQGLEQLSETAKSLWSAAPALWLLAGLGTILLFWEPTLRRWRFFLAGFALFSFMAVSPGFYFRNHYFVLLLPAAGLLCGAATCAMARSGGRLARCVARKVGVRDEALRYLSEPGFELATKGATAALFVIAAGQSLAVSSDVFFRLTPDEASLSEYGLSPFPESAAVAQHIAENCAPEARIAVLGSEPQIYFYSHRRAATGYLYTYPLMEPQPFAREMQYEMIREIEAAAPDYLVFVLVPTSWQERSESDTSIFKWFGRYSRDKMRLDGLVEFFSDHTETHWDLEGQDIHAKTDFWIAIFKKNRAS